MLEIELTKRYNTVIDDEDYDLVKNYKWASVVDKKSGTVYVRAKKTEDHKRKTVYLHRLIMAAEKGQVVDHINRDGLDNRRENLKLYSSHSEHMSGNNNHKRGGRYKYYKDPIEYYI